MFRRLSGKTISPSMLSFFCWITWFDIQAKPEKLEVKTPHSFKTHKIFSPNDSHIADKIASFQNNWNEMLLTGYGYDFTMRRAIQFAIEL